MVEKRRWFVFSTDCLRFNKVRKKRGRKEWEVEGKRRGCGIWRGEGGEEEKWKGGGLFVIFRQFI